MLTARLHRAVGRAAELPEVTQDAPAAALEQLLQRYEGQPLERDPELSAIVEQSMRELADTLEYLKGE